MGKHYNFSFYPKLGHGICAIRRIPCAGVGCTSIIGQPWFYGISLKKKTCYQPVTNCTYWPVLVSYNNFNIIEITPKSTPFEAFDDIHQVVLGGISDNMASLVHSGKYGPINKSDTTTNGLYVIKFISEAYTLQNNTQIDGQVISAGGLVFQAQYICYMQENYSWYWKQQPLQHTIIVPTRTIIHPCLGVVIITYVQYIPKNVYTRIQSKEAIQRRPICMTDSSYNYILDEIEHQEN